MANETEKAIAEEIAARSPFTAQDIYSAWENCRSFDLVLAGAEYCLTFGLGDLSLAISRLKQRAAWISLKDRYPDEHTGILVTDGENVWSARWHAVHSVSGEKIDIWSCHGFSGEEMMDEFRTPTHWTNLPGTLETEIEDRISD